MAATPTPVEGVHSAWRRIGLWLEDWAEAFEFDISDYHARRIAQLELEVAALRSRPAVPGDTASSQQPADKEAS